MTRRRKSWLKIKDTRKFELIADFLIKFNLLAIPMYAIMFADITFYPLQLFLTEIVYKVIESAGYWIAKSGITIILFAPVEPPGPPLAQQITMGFDCTAWKTIYTFAALVIATPVAGMWKKLRFIIIGSVALFAINVVRLITTLIAAYTLGFEYLEIMHTLLWREGLILALIALWLIWLRKQKNNISQSQTIFRALYSLSRSKKKRKSKRKMRKKR